MTYRTWIPVLLAVAAAFTFASTVEAQQFNETVYITLTVQSGPTTTVSPTMQTLTKPKGGGSGTLEVTITTGGVATTFDQDVDWNGFDGYWQNMSSAAFTVPNGSTVQADFITKKGDDLGTTTVSV